MVFVYSIFYPEFILNILGHILWFIAFRWELKIGWVLYCALFSSWVGTNLSSVRT